MFRLKEYQQLTLESLQAYFRLCHQFGNADTAFYELTRQTFGTGLPYQGVKDLPGLPYICLRIPTGGGKTLVACHAVSIAQRDFLRADTSVVLWLVPSNAIREQTLNALKNLQHPYRQALDATLGAVTILDISEALFVKPTTLNTVTTIIVSTIQVFRVEDTEARKVYEPNGALMDHFTQKDLSGFENLTGLSNMDCYEDGRPKPTLANVFWLRRPVVIVDEAHNVRTELSFSMLARFNPSCIIEFTATPDTKKNPSNVLHSVSAAELKAEDMIKMPILLTNRPQWKELLGDAISTRNHLETLARQERQLTREYIRPIMLLQAQPTYKNKSSISVDVVEQCLLEDYNIPAEQIARATGSDKGLEGIDLSAPDCPIRYVITIQALKEGWDCPFAYVLCSVAETYSSTAVEQLLGRILRLPTAKRKEHKELNTAYAFAASANFTAVANELADALVQNGFEKQEAKDLISQYNPQKIIDFGPLFEPPAQKSGEMTFITKDPPLLHCLSTETVAKISYLPDQKIMIVKEPLDENELQQVKHCFSSSESQQAFEQAYHQQKSKHKGFSANREENFSIPVLAIKQGDLFEQFEETHFLEVEWNLATCNAQLSEEEFPIERSSGQQSEIYVTEQGRISTRFLSELQQQMTFLTTDQKWTVAQLVYWLDHSIHHPDIPPEQSGVFLTQVVQRLIDERQLNLEKLVYEKYRLKEAVIAKINTHRQMAHQSAYQRLLLPDSPTPLTVTPEVCFSFDPESYPYNKLYQGSYTFQKHFYPDHVGDLTYGSEEFECAQFIDAMLPEVKVWVRNLERRPNHAFWLQTATDKFYPDFVCKLKDNRYLVIEYKGEHLWSNDDSKEKRNLGELWEKRSNGLCLFIMPKGKDFEAIRTKIRQT
ncbi:type III restriction protein res subunit [Candidatus Vecturithrix granuli]|uniref:Type III restriction protein res subunit n=1 Tax=Vecturithrix granuli TaxID=1499967 RepID=A0A081C8J0_VECG1|nr:type III restriction protein res subunit [Candidatus Vecturithrix granuli]